MTLARAAHRGLPRTHDTVHPPQRPARALRPAGRAWFLRRYDMHVHAGHHPPPGPAIVAANHIGLLDGPLMAAGRELRHVHTGVAHLALVTGAPVVPLAIFGTREPGGGVDSVPARGARFDFVYGAPGHWEQRPWPRTQDDVRRTAAAVRNRCAEHLVEAKACTGRELPGPLPQITEKDVREARGVSRRTRA